MLQITKIMPNPDGKDAGKEWIELKPIGNQFIFNNLEIISQGLKNKKVIHKSEIIEIKDKMKLSLKNAPNSKAHIQVYINSVLVDELKYKKAPEEQIYKKTTVTDYFGGQKTKWIWSDSEKETFQEWQFIKIKTSPPHLEEIPNSQQKAILTENSLALIMTEESQLKTLKIIDHKKKSLETTNIYFYWPLIISIFIFSLFQILKLNSGKHS